MDANGNDLTITTDIGLFSKIEIGGDVTAYFAEYLGMLTTEYWLLHNTGKAGSDEEKAVLNEIFLPTKQHFLLSLFLITIKYGKNSKYFNYSNNNFAIGV